jgi:5-methylcytosine-specific restriction endonuclease McrA
VDTERSRKKRDSATYRRQRRLVKRDQSVCGICGGPIDPGLEYPHPGSWTLHHILPIALGGSLSDRANMVAAHKRCNEQHGDGRRRKPRTKGDLSASW